jgi:ACS family hexuronate transporter-like MFS transporter
MSDAARPARSNYRWVICALIFFATTINYVDRTVIGVLESTLQKEIGWTDTQWGDIGASFSLAYGIGLLFAGWIIDRLGPRLGYALYLVVWSFAAAAHALASTVQHFLIIRFALGLGESGNFPAAIRTVAEWFPQRERALATGIFNAGTNVGAILSPLLVPIIALHFGWKWAFIGTGVAGLIWVFFWWPMYRRPQDHPRVSAAELAHIESDPSPPPVKVPWRVLITYKQTWAFAIAKFLTDPIWWFWLFWLPPFLKDLYNIDLKTIGAPMITVYLLADVGSVMGGWQSGWLIKRGWSPNWARKTAMLTYGLCVVPVVFAPLVGVKWAAIILIGIAAAAHQGFSANLFTTTSDMFPRWAVGSVVGIGGFAGAMGGFLFQSIAGRIKDAIEERGEASNMAYLPLFIYAASAYLVALLIVHVIVPRLEPIKLDPNAQPA